ncbi:MAG: YraN family protein [Azoarcus sp.]|nr:YraN family protein [Azoarcus sp.]
MGDIAGRKRQNEPAAIVEASRPSAQARGRLGEARAAAWLAQHGLRIVARNVRCRGGELDLVCLERGALVFVEVRLRSNARFGGAAQSITAAKRQRIVHAARVWLAWQGRAHQNRPCRFDVVLFDDAAASDPQWIRGAFEWA